MHTRLFLLELTNPEKTPRVPKDVRETASYCLRHYPSEWEMQQAADASPHLFAERMEEVTRLFKQYEQSKANRNEA
jgi:hypothetical protein